MKTNLEQAIEYVVKYGFKIIPVNWVNEDGTCSCGKKDCTSVGKHPLTSLVPNGLKNFSDDLQVITDWFTKYPNANIGIVTGKTSNILVLDIDPRNGGDKSFNEIKPLLGDSINTLTVLTGGGGRHLYFQYPEGLLVKSRSGVEKGIDIKSDGGYVVAPPSNHSSGGVYSFEIVESKIINATSELINFINEDFPRRYPNRNTEVNSFQEQGSVLEGSRNEYLTSIAGKLRREGFDEDKIYDSLQNTNLNQCKPPLGKEEVASIARSIARYKPEILPSENFKDRQYLSKEFIDKQLKVNKEKPNMNFNMLPVPVKDFLKWVKDATAAPDEFFACSFIGLFASAMGKNIVLEWPLGYIRPIVWIACLAPSGVKKTTALVLTKRLATKLEKSLLNQKKAAKKEYEIALDRYLSDRKKGKCDSESEPEYPSIRNIFLPSLTSSQKLYESLAKDYAGGLIYQESELSSLLLDWKNERNSGMATTMMALFDSADIVEPPSYRNSEDLPIIESPTVSIVGASVESTFLKRFSEEDFISGLIQRWLIALTNCSKKTKGWPNKLPEGGQERFEKLIEVVFNLNKDLDKELIVYKVSSEMQMYWDQVYDTLNDDFPDIDNETILSCLNRINDTYILRFALIFECMKSLYLHLNDESHKLEFNISKESIDEAVELSKYFKLGVIRVINDLQGISLKELGGKIVDKLRDSSGKKQRLSALKTLMNYYKQGHYAKRFDETILRLKELGIICITIEDNDSNNDSITEWVWLLEE